MKSRLQSLGFSAEVIEDLSFFIKDEQSFDRFCSFSIENDGNFQSDLQLAYQFMNMLEKEEHISKKDFVDKYNTNLHLASYVKKNILERAFGRRIDNQAIVLADALLSNGMSKEELYDKINSNKGIHNPLNSLKIISIKQKRNNFTKKQELTVDIV